MLITRRAVALWARGVLAGLSLAAIGAAAARAADVPYRLPAAVPRTVSSPAVDPSAPYTPLVRSLIRQLEPHDPPTFGELQNAARLFQGGIGGVTAGASSCHGIGGITAPTGTKPSIAPLCWADAVGINLITGPNVGKTTATPEPLAIGSTFDRALANAWGQVEGLEGRRLMVTGLYGPEADVSIYPNWERGLDTLGEDPYVAGVMTAAQVDGVQGRGLMAQVKHLAGFAGSHRYLLAQFTDQVMHEMFLAPFELSFTDARAASTMCSYQLYQVLSSHLPTPRDALGAGASPYASGDATKTWPLNEPHWACEQPYALAYALRDLWHSVAFVASDYPSIHSTAAMTQGAAQEFPAAYFFANTDPLQPGPPVLADAFGDPTGDTCAVANQPADCSATGARHVSGIPGTRCNPDNGCGLVNAVFTGAMPLAVFNQALAEVLYQEERFGLLGCDEIPRAASCTNQGGVDGDRSGNAALPVGPREGASPASDLGTKNGDAAVVERMAEEGAVLLKNNDGVLPISGGDITGKVLVAGPGAEYLVAAPSNEASTGFADRDAVNPLAQLKALSGHAGAFEYAPANGPTGQAVPSSALSSSNTTVTGGLDRVAGPGAPGIDATLDFTKVSEQGQLAAGNYVWSGYVHVPTDDDYTFRFQSTPGTSVVFTLDGQPKALSAPPSTYCGQYFGHNVCVPVSPTNAGYTEAGLTNQQAAAGALSAGYQHVTIAFANSSGSPASLRFAYSRKDGDIADAAQAARGKALAVVFASDNGVPVVDQDAETPPSREVASLPDADARLIEAVADANPNTVVVLNTADPVIVKPWVGKVKGLLEMWNAGSEGGTATARLLLGQANPSGHTVFTWPAAGTDTIWAYKQTRPLYPGDTPGAHPERLNGADDTNQADCLSQTPPTTTCHKTVMSQGIFSGYRFYDQQRLEPQFPFGFGLSYTKFAFSALAVTPSRGGGADVAFTVRNTGPVAGDEVAQVYVGPGPDAPGIQQAVRSLRGFERVSLAAGEDKRVSVHLDERSFQYWDEKSQRWQTNAGRRRIWVGDADAPERLPLTTTTRVGSSSRANQRASKAHRTRCATRRTITIRLGRRHPRSVTVLVDGRRRAVLRRPRGAARVRVPKTTGALIRVRLLIGGLGHRAVSRRTTYHTCSLKPARTRRRAKRAR